MSQHAAQLTRRSENRTVSHTGSHS
jgi:hypothetical protein